MKTIGMIGGMSWESTASYYRLVNQGVKAALGGLHSAKVILVSVDFHEIEALQMAGDWHAAGVALAEAAKQLEAAGADFVMICTNTMHLVSETVVAATALPLLHIADATAAEIKKQGYRKVGLLGTRFTMEKDFYKGRLHSHFGIEAMVPDEADRATIHRVIYEELCQGIVTESSRTAYLDVIDRLKEAGAEAIILGCTEIGLLVDNSHTELPLLDTTAIHAAAAVKIATGTD